MNEKELDIDRLLQVKDVEWAYIAGFFDGEGSVGVYHRTAGGNAKGAIYYTTMVQISQKRRAVLDWMVERTGLGTVMQYKDRRTHDMHKWYVQGNSSCLTFLRFIAPYVIEKKDQVELAVHFCRNFKNMTNDARDNVIELISDMKRSA
jgi:hypothetical protein